MSLSSPISKNEEEEDDHPVLGALGRQHSPLTQYHPALRSYKQPSREKSNPLPRIEFVISPDDHHIYHIEKHDMNTVEGVQ